MCSSAAIYYTQDLIDAISIKYKNQKIASKYPAWHVATHMWTSETLLPFVYFVLTCNPSFRDWENIKRFTALVSKAYHYENPEPNIEKLTQFILWHTEVIYHILQLGPKIKSSQGTPIKHSMDIQLKAPKLSTLAMIVYLFHSDSDSFTANQSTRDILERHVSVTFERDYQLGYPTRQNDQDVYDSLRSKWETKSDEITTTAKDVHWPKCQFPLRSKSEPMLLLNGDIENDMRVKQDPQVSSFIHNWQTHFLETVRFIRNSKPENLGFPPYTLKNFSRGIHLFLQDSLPGSDKFEVTLFAEFIHQDPQDEFFVDFWEKFDASDSGRFLNQQKRRKSRVEVRP
ncbi:uncharacterized protein MELLADRAFT_65822 [Melampsora larici-populina 98AG31]|uniref:Uncharacterized protein n=1 Tax=Melampsora larici-populina (strain 98AG31 / pathotype 3-4-7) TaxID=747676 RepID=F4RWU3_MELLP|nr:uncharacterized protein MELLADRAFT_65822 [Melampsora larici-populina 98AG31]EGG03165.1 hypothetical protein MELLADRAFT_65822 [Melampsora larici-populina 98AG31]